MYELKGGEMKGLYYELYGAKGGAMHMADAIKAIGGYYPSAEEYLGTLIMNRFDTDKDKILTTKDLERVRKVLGLGKD